VLEKIRIANPFVVRTVDPPVDALEGQRVTGLRRIGKRIVIAFEHELYCVIHLMIAGRLKWLPADGKGAGKIALASWCFSTGVLVLTEAGSKRRASIHVVRGEAALASLDPGGADPFAIDLAEFASRLRRERHTVKRSLTDPRLFSGIGNAYSDEILHRAKLSPFKLTDKLDDDELSRLFDATRTTLSDWTDFLRKDAGVKFPEKVTAFRKGMAVHGRYGEPCPECGAPVQRVVFADNEMNYCARCQTGGKIMADRALSDRRQDHGRRRAQPGAARQL
jgi:formamidopyrimidine-DNA glycosylase